MTTFMLAHSVLLKPLPIAGPDELVQLTETSTSYSTTVFSYPAFREIARRTDLFASTVGFSPRLSVIELDEKARSINVEVITAGFFKLFEARPTLGRLLQTEDDVEGAPLVCVISHAVWRELFGGHDAIIGRMATIDGRRFEIVGVANAEFVGPDYHNRVELWMSTGAMKALYGRSRENRSRIWLRVMARLQPKVSFEKAKAVLASSISGGDDTRGGAVASDRVRYDVERGNLGVDVWRTQLREPVMALMLLSLSLLLLGSANVSGFLLTRFYERQREFAIKSALGMGRWRVVSQAMIEAAMIAAMGAVCGFCMSTAIVPRFLDAFNTGRATERLHIGFDYRPVICAAMLGIAIATITTTWSVWRLTAAGNATRLSDGGRVSWRSRAWARVLITIQVSLAVVLLYGASAFTRSLLALTATPLGYEVRGVSVVTISRRSGAEMTGETSQEALVGVMERVRALPGVHVAALSRPGILGGPLMRGQFTYTAVSGESHTGNASFLLASEGYLTTIGARVLRGRDLTEGDRRGAAPVALISKRLARELGARGGDPIGGRIVGWGDVNAEIVGVVDDMRCEGPRAEGGSLVIQPIRQSSVVSGALVVRGGLSGVTLEEEVRRTVRALTLEYQVTGSSTLVRLLDGLVARERVVAVVAEVLGAFAIVLAAAGVYGLVSTSVTVRSHEIGVRRCLGASGVSIVGVFMRETLVMVCIGILIGCAMSSVSMRGVEALLYKVAVFDIGSIVGAVSVVTVAGVAATIVPAMRAVKVEPSSVIREAGER